MKKFEISPTVVGPPADARIQIPRVDLSEIEETVRCLTALVEAIEAGELEATSYLYGYLRGALTTLQSIEF